MPNIDVLVDLQFGSTGKGQIAGWLGYKKQYSTAIAVNMPNAGHTFIDPHGKKFVTHALPSAAFTPYCRRALIGPGSVFDFETLKAEIEMLRDRVEGEPKTICIHEGAWILNQEAINMEHLQGLGSTRRGSGAARVQKIARGNGLEIWRAGDFAEELQKIDAYIINQRDWMLIVTVSDGLLEGSQGYSLSIDSSFYPFTTSRNCTTASFVSEAMVPMNKIRNVYGIMRVHPIRVAGESGGWYGDQKETSWEELGVEPEITTTTKKIRRVATFSMTQINEAMFYCAPNRYFLTHCDYDAVEAKKIQEWMKKFEPECKLAGATYGPEFHQMTGIVV